MLIGLGIFAAVLSLRSISRVRKTERVNRELVDQAVRGEVPIPMPAKRGGVDAAFWAAIGAGVPLQTRSRGHVI
jgi:hypothetical protein